MTSWITSLLLVGALAASAAAGAQPASPSSKASARSSPHDSLVVGASVSLTGAHADLAADYGRGLEHWAQETNAAGGILGRPVELRILDDGSSARRAGEAYRQLIGAQADALIGPYGSAATLLAAAEAEAAQRVLVNGAGWSREIHRRNPRFVFQTAVPYGAYGNVMKLAQAAGITRAFLLHRDDPASREMAAAAQAAAPEAGVSAGEAQAYPASTIDFTPYVQSARASGAQAWIAFGSVADAAQMIKTFKRLKYAPAFFFASGSADRRVLRLVGQDAERSLGAVRYHPGAPTSGNDRFVRSFEARWGTAPTPAAAEGYAAGTVLAEALRRAGTTDPASLAATLSTMRTETVLGEYRVDPASGAQLATEPLVTQVLRAQFPIAWPPALRKESSVLPYPLLSYPEWAEREYFE